MARGDPGEKKDKKKDKKEKKDKEKKEKKDGKKETDLSASDAKPPESPKAAPEVAAPAPTAAVAPPPGPAPSEVPAPASPAAAPVSPIPAAAAEPKEAVGPASPKREKEEKKAITRNERSKTVDDGIPMHARKEKEGKPRYESVDLNKQVIIRTPTTVIILPDLCCGFVVHAAQIGALLPT